MSILVVGCGYLGWRVARRWVDQGALVHAVTRSHERADQMRSLGIRPIVADIMRPPTLSSLPAVDVVVYAVGYDRHSGWTRYDVYIDGLRNLLDALPSSVERLIYISSTGVYGQIDGSWVDEQSRCQPTREGGRVCLAAEQLLTTHSTGKKRIVLRLAGIYGPGRIPQLDRLAAGEEIFVPAQGFLNLIHVDDAAMIVLAAAVGARPPALYLVSDGRPVDRREFYRSVVHHRGLPSPRFRASPSDAQVAPRTTSSKRIRNKKIVHDLQITLCYPSYQMGLVDALKGQ